MSTQDKTTLISKHTADEIRCGRPHDLVQPHRCVHAQTHTFTPTHTHSCTHVHTLSQISVTPKNTTESPAAAEGNCVRGRHGSRREGVLLLRAHANSRGPVPPWSLVRGRRPAPPASEKVSSCQTQRALVRGELNSHQIY